MSKSIQKLKPLLLQTVTTKDQTPSTDQSHAMISVSKERHVNYCLKHDYHLSVDEIEMDISKFWSICWERWRTIRFHLASGKYSHVFHLDADAVIAKTDVDLRDVFGDGDGWLAVTIHAHPTQFNTFHLQAGIMYWRACPEAIEFIDAVLSHQEKAETQGYGIADQSGLNYEMLYGPNAARFQKGLVILPHKWNANIHNQPHEDAIVGAFHGCPDRLNRFTEYVNQLVATDTGNSPKEEPFNTSKATADAVLLARSGRVNEADQLFHNILQVDANQLDARREYGKLLASPGLDRQVEAITHFAHCAAQEPSRARHAFQLANTYAAIGDHERAGHWYNHLLAAEPNNPYYQWCASLHFLGSRQWAKGWEAYHRGYAYRVPRPRHWSSQSRPEDVKPGETLFVCAEQGHGDWVFFSRYLPHLRAKCPHARIVLEVHDLLLPLVDNAAFHDFCDQVIVFDHANWDFSTPFDKWCSMGSLPYLLDMTEPIGPSPSVGGMFVASSLPYMQRDENKFNIGACWRGSKAHPDDRLRSFGYDVIHNIISLSHIPQEDILLSSLQWGPAAYEANADKSIVMRDVSTMDRLTGAIYSQDYILSCDTLAANMAGTLGIPGSVLCAISNDWRWTFDQEHSPFYSSMTVCRQSEFKEWKAAIILAAFDLKSKYDEWKSK